MNSILGDAMATTSVATRPEPLALVQSHEILGSAIGACLPGITVYDLGESSLVHEPLHDKHTTFYEVRLHSNGGVSREFLHRPGLVDLRKVQHCSGALEGVAVEFLADCLLGKGPAAVPAVIEVEYDFDTDREMQRPGSGSITIRFFSTRDEAFAYAMLLEVRHSLAMSVKAMDGIKAKLARISGLNTPANFAVSQCGLIAQQIELVHDLLAEQGRLVA